MSSANDVASTRAVLRERQEIIIAAMSRYIARPERGTPQPSHTAIASALFEAMLTCLPGEAARPFDLPANIDREDIVRFGDGLLPILRDIVGTDITATSLSRVSDAYWRAIDSAGAPAN